MEQAVIQSASQYGIIALLFVWLFFYQIKDSREREKKYQETIKDNSKTIINLTQMAANDETIRHDIKEIKQDVKEIKLSGNIKKVSIQDGTVVS